MTLDLSGSQSAQKTFSRWLRGWGLPLERIWLEPSGARCTLAGIPAEIDLGLSVEEGALLVEFEHARQTFIGRSKLDDSLWRWKLPQIVAALKPPPGVSLVLDAGWKVLRVRVRGLAFTQVLVSAERLILEAVL